MARSYSRLYEEGEVDHINCHTRPPNEEELIKGQGKWRLQGLYIVRQVGGWVDQKLLKLII